LAILHLCWHTATSKEYLLKNSQAVKKGAALCKMTNIKKVVKYRWWPRNGCDGKSVTKILITTIQVNLYCLISASLGIGKKIHPNCRY